MRGSSITSRSFSRHASSSFVIHRSYKTCVYLHVLTFGEFSASSSRLHRRRSHHNFSSLFLFFFSLFSCLFTHSLLCTCRSSRTHNLVLASPNVLASIRGRKVWVCLHRPTCFWNLPFIITIWLTKSQHGLCSSAQSLPGNRIPLTARKNDT